MKYYKDDVTTITTTPGHLLTDTQNNQARLSTGAQDDPSMAQDLANSISGMYICNHKMSLSATVMLTGLT